MRLFSNRSQRTSKCDKNISDTLRCSSCATFLFLPHFDVNCDLLLNRRTATWNLFVKCIRSESRKKEQKNKHRKTWMKWNDTKWTVWYFHQCACVNAIYFAAVVTTTYRMKNNKSSTRGLSLEVSVLAGARAQLLNVLYISTTKGKYLQDCSIYKELGTIHESSWVDEWDLSNMV